MGVVEKLSASLTYVRLSLALWLGGSRASTLFIVDSLCIYGFLSAAHPFDQLLHTQQIHHYKLREIIT
ncbi:hypothetical protein BDV26DRAFT_263122, partial [Aspergillus bertholletiae]